MKQKQEVMQNASPTFLLWSWANIKGLCEIAIRMSKCILSILILMTVWEQTVHGSAQPAWSNTVEPFPIPVILQAAAPAHFPFLNVPLSLHWQGSPLSPTPQRLAN